MKQLALSIVLSIITTTIFAQNVNLEWAKSMGGVSNDEGNSIAIDANGNTYTTGEFYNTVDFDPGVGVFNLTSNGWNDIFIQKLDANGNFVWAKSLGGPTHSLYETGKSIFVDVGGNVYITGGFWGTVDFDPGVGVFNLTTNGVTDIFILKLDAAGSFIWAKSLGGTSEEVGNSIVVDANGDVNVVGNFYSTVDFDPGAGIFNLTAVGYKDFFVLKLDANGNFVWAKSMGANVGGHQEGISITTDANNNVCITGSFQNTVDFDPGAGVFNLTSSIGWASNIFVLKLDVNGNFIWAKSMGATGGDIGRSIVTDVSGNIYTTGYFKGTVDFNPGIGIFSLTSNGSDDAFIQKLDANGNFIWAKALGGGSYDGGNSITIDVNNDVYITGGFFGSVDFNPGIGIFNLVAWAGGRDIFILKLGANGNFKWAKSLTGNGTGDEGNSIVTDVNENVYITGFFGGNIDMNPGTGVLSFSSNGNNDIFVQKFSLCTSISVGTDTRTECSPYVWIDGNTYTTNNTTAKDTIVGGAFYGCDSLVTLNLTILNGTTGIDTRTECSPYVWIDGNTYTSNNTTAKDTLVGAAANGCDSIVTLNLTILNSATGTDVQTACNSYLWTDGNTYTTNNTTAKDTLVGAAANGCDSIVTLNLTILNSATGTDVQTACNSYLWTDGNTYTANNTTAKDTLVAGAANGCDSIVTLNLTILNSATGTDVQTACKSYLWIDGNTYTANNTTAKDTLVGAAANGCDSIVTLNLTILNSATGTDTRTECSPFVWIDGNTYTTNNTTAKDTLVAGAANGCDSIVTLNLTITTVDTSVTQAGTNLSANELVATYQWLDCDNNYAVIPGETSRTYYVLADGNYAVEVTYYGCADTSSCYNVIVSSVAENTINNNITIYPNPVNNQLTVNTEGEKINSIKIIDVTGKTLKTVVANTTTINVADLAKGIYFLQIQTEKGIGTKRFIKE